MEFLMPFWPGASEVWGDEFRGLWLHSPAAANANVSRPSILFIMSDGHWPDVLKPG